MSDSTAWAGRATRIIFKVALSIDNLVWIAVLAEKPPPHPCDRAHSIGLRFALGMRLIMLASRAWIVTLQPDLLILLGHGFLGRNLILIFGGLCLLLKGTTKLEERLAGHQAPKAIAWFTWSSGRFYCRSSRGTLSFRAIACVITALGMVAPKSLSVLQLMAMLRKAPVHLALVVDEFGTVVRLVTPTDVLKAIATIYPGKDEKAHFRARQADGSWFSEGWLCGAVPLLNIAPAQVERRPTLAAYALPHIDDPPQAGDPLDIDGDRVR